MTWWFLDIFVRFLNLNSFKIFIKIFCSLILADLSWWRILGFHIDVIIKSFQLIFWNNYAQSRFCLLILQLFQLSAPLISGDGSLIFRKMTRQSVSGRGVLRKVHFIGVESALMIQFSVFVRAHILGWRDDNTRLRVWRLILKLLNSVHIFWLATLHSILILIAISLAQLFICSHSRAGENPSPSISIVLLRFGLSHKVIILPLINITLIVRYVSNLSWLLLLPSPIN